MPLHRNVGAKINSPEQSEHWYLKVQGNATQVSRKLNFSKIPPRVLRGRITAFSRQARMRMLRFVAHCNWPAIGKSLFITLTYPDSHARETVAARGMHKSLFFRYAEKFLGRQVPALWRVEWKPRQSGEYTGIVVPHFHLLVCGVRYLHWARVRAWWRQILEVKGPLCTDVQGIEGEGGVADYVAKYAGKIASLDIGTYQSSVDPSGRHWGVRRKSAIPTHPVAILRQIFEAEVEWCQMIATGVFPRYNPLLDGGFTLLGREYAARFSDEFAEIA